MTFCLIAADSEQERLHLEKQLKLLLQSDENRFGLVFFYFYFYCSTDVQRLTSLSKTKSQKAFLFPCSTHIIIVTLMNIYVN